MASDTNITIVHTDPAKIKNLINRRHPEYNDRKEHWRFCMATYESELNWYKDNLFKFVREGDDTYAGRIERAYRFNHTREVVDLTTKYLFKGEKIRRAEGVPEEIKRFREVATINRRPLTEHMRHGARLASIFGRVYTIVDSTMKEGVHSRAEEKAAKMGTYVYWIDPLSALDFAFDELGDYEWFLVRETIREDDDPFESSGSMVERFRLWGKNEWALYGKNSNGVYGLIESGRTDLDRVPIVPLDDMPNSEKYAVPALIRDVAYLDRAVANYLSNLDQIINDQTFSQLVMSAQSSLFTNTSSGIMDDSGNIDMEQYQKNVVALGTAQVLVYDGEHGEAPHYISPDPKQATVITTVIKQIVNEIYHSVGLAGERTKQDNSMGIDNSSGVAKAFDFERVSSLLTAKAAALEAAERCMQGVVLAYHGKSSERSKYDDQVVYPSSFDVRGMAEELALAADLGTLEVPVEIRKEQLRLVVEKIFPLVSDELAQKLEKSIDDWDPDELPSTAEAFDSTINRQGQVTDKTDKD